MLCISTSGVTSTPISINDELLINRAYISEVDLPSFPSRLVFDLPQEELHSIIESVVPNDGPAELLEETQRLLAVDIVKLVVPVARRVQDTVFTSFSQRSNIPHNAIDITTSAPTIFINGRMMPNICAACSRQSTLKGRRCPDYVEGSYSCLKSSNFSLNYMQTFYLNEKGDLVYHATCIDTDTDESQNDANTGANSTEIS